MNRNRIAALVIAGVCSTSTIEYLKVRKAETKKREEIQVKRDKDIHAINVGAERVIEKMRNGEYMPRSLEELYATLKFEQIAAYNE